LITQRDASHPTKKSSIQATNRGFFSDAEKHERGTSPLSARYRQDYPSRIWKPLGKPIQVDGVSYESRRLEATPGPARQGIRPRPKGCGPVRTDHKPLPQGRRNMIGRRAYTGACRKPKTQIRAFCGRRRNVTTVRLTILEFPARREDCPDQFRQIKAFRGASDFSNQLHRAFVGGWCGVIETSCSWSVTQRTREDRHYAKTSARAQRRIVVNSHGSRCAHGREGGSHKPFCSAAASAADQSWRCLVCRQQSRSGTLSSLSASQ